MVAARRALYASHVVVTMELTIRPAARRPDGEWLMVADSREQSEQLPKSIRGLLDTPYSLTEARVLFELGQRDEAEVADLRRTLDLDAGYLSRLLARFVARFSAIKSK